MKFKAVSAEVKAAKEKPVTKEERIKEAKSFWSAFFKVHSTKNVQKRK